MALKEWVFDRSQALTDIIWYPNTYYHFFHEMKWFSDQSLASPTLRGNIISSLHSKRYPSLHSFFIESIQLVYLNPKLLNLQKISVRGTDFRLSVVRKSFEWFKWYRYLEISNYNRLVQADIVMSSNMTVFMPLQTNFIQIACKYLCIKRRPMGFFHFVDLYFRKILKLL